MKGVRAASNDWTTLRRRIGNRPVVGITGSYAKSSTKQLLSEGLTPQFQVVSNRASYNVRDGMYSTFRRATSDTDIVIQEVGATGPGSLDGLLSRLLPTVGVLTAVADDHLARFANRAAVLREKFKIVQSLTSDGTAILNIDDPMIAAKVSSVHCRIRTFGRHPQANYRARNVSAEWPDHLSFELTVGSSTYQVSTRLLGEHNIVCVLAAIAAADTLGADLQKFIDRLGEIEGPRGRMEEHVRSDNLTIILDSVKAGGYMLEDAIAFLRRARARNRYLVLGQISDTPKKGGRAIRAVATACRKSNINLITIGEMRKKSLRKEEFGFYDDGVGVFESFMEVLNFIDDNLSSEDVVLVKCNQSSHLGRILLAEKYDVKCRALSCGRKHGCSSCPELANAHPPEFKFEATKA